jgi:anthranilate phosphoribosyltransferase
VFGVYAPDLARTYAEALAGLGARRAFVVHGSGGTDELTTGGANLVLEVVDGAIRESELDPRDVGLERSDPADLRGGSPFENAAAIRRVLEGERSGRRDAVVLNAAGALVAAGVVDDLAEGVAEAARAVDSGEAGATLDRLVVFSNAVAA